MIDEVHATYTVHTYVGGPGFEGGTGFVRGLSFNLGPGFEGSLGFIDGYVMTVGLVLIVGQVLKEAGFLLIS